jgi:hypothetical protein
MMMLLMTPSLSLNLPIIGACHSGGAAQGPVQVQAFEMKELNFQLIT